MATSLGTTYVDLVARLDNFSKGMKKASQTLTKFGNKTKSIGKAMSTYITAPAVGMAAITVKAFAEQERAVNSLESALKGSGQEVTNNSKQMQELASAIQKTTTFGDEMTLQLMATATNMGIQSGQMEEATKGAIGLSKAFGLDLKMSMRAVSAALQGDTMLLNRYIPQLRSVSDESEKLAIVQHAMASGFRQAEADAKTTAGRILQMKNAIGDTMEIIGGAIAPVLTPFVSKLQALAERLQQINPTTLKWIVGLTAAAAAIGPLVLAAGLLISSLGSIMGVLAAISATLLGPIAVAVAVATAAFLMFSETGQRFMQSFAGPKIAGAIRNFGIALMTEASRFGWKMLDNIINLGKYIIAVVGGAFKWVGEQWGDAIFMDIERIKIGFMRMFAEVQAVNPFAKEENHQGLNRAIQEAEVSLKAMEIHLRKSGQSFGDAMHESINNVELSNLADQMAPVIDRWADGANNGADAISDSFVESESIVGKIKDMLGLGGTAIKDGSEAGAKILEETLSGVGGLVGKLTGTTAKKSPGDWSMTDDFDQSKPSSVSSPGRSFRIESTATQETEKSMFDLAREANNTMKALGDYVKVESVGGEEERKFRVFEDGFKGELLTREELEERLGQNSQSSPGGGGGEGKSTDGKKANPLTEIAKSLESIENILNSLKGAIA